MSALNGVSVLVAGAGLAGLTAARDLTALGASVTVVEARDRVGGRVWTIRDGFKDGQHAEGGADLIDGSQQEIQKLAAELGLELTRILRGGWGFVRPDGQRPAPHRAARRRRAAGTGWPKQVLRSANRTGSPNGAGNRRSSPTSDGNRSPSG